MTGDSKAKLAARRFITDGQIDVDVAVQDQ
jgi:hypothetical protein